jgi:hypothetical protein
MSPQSDLDYELWFYPSPVSFDVSYPNIRSIEVVGILSSTSRKSLGVLPYARSLSAPQC